MDQVSYFASFFFTAINFLSFIKGQESVDIKSIWYFAFLVANLLITVLIFVCFHQRHLQSLLVFLLTVQAITAGSLPVIGRLFMDRGDIVEEIINIAMSATFVPM